MPGYPSLACARGWHDRHLGGNARLCSLAGFGNSFRLELTEQKRAELPLQ
jgi:hypothetical protein